jgi:hypothetical protein
MDIVKSVTCVPLPEVDENLLFNIGADNMEELLTVFPGVIGIKVMEYHKYYQETLNFEMIRKWIDSFENGRYSNLKYCQFIREYYNNNGFRPKTPNSFDGIPEYIFKEYENYTDYSPIFPIEPEATEMKEVEME